MATYTLNLGTLKTGLTDLRAQTFTTSGTLLATVSTGFTEVGGGQYLWSYTPTQNGYIRFYRAATPSDIYGIASVNIGEEPPASTTPSTVAAYLYARDASGTALPGATVSYQLIKPDADGAWDDEVQTVTADGTGLVTIEMVYGHYEYWVNNGRHKTVRITSETANPYALPQVTG